MYGHSKNCANPKLDDCKENVGFCIGRANANFVYTIIGKIRRSFLIAYLTFVYTIGRHSHTVTAEDNPPPRQALNRGENIFST